MSGLFSAHKDVRFIPQGTGFVTQPGCIQCQQPCGQARKFGKAKAGNLRGLKGWVCAACQGVNAPAPAAEGTAP